MKGASSGSLALLFVSQFLVDVDGFHHAVVPMTALLQFRSNVNLVSIQNSQQFINRRLARKHSATAADPSDQFSDETNEKDHSPHTPSFQECLAFTLPALGIYICSPLMSLIDAAFIGRSSSIELAALGPASSISDSAPLPLLFLSIAATNLIAKSFSQKDTAASARVSRAALGMGSICGVFLAILLYTYANPISFLYCGGGGSAATRATANLLSPGCSQYVAIRALALPAVVITTIAQAICIGTKDTRTPMISVALAGGLNLFGDMILVKLMGKGIAGAAWATAGSQVLAAGLLLRVLKKRGFLAKQEQGAANSAIASTTSDTQQTTTQESDVNISTMTTVKQLLSFIPFLFVMMVKIGWHNSCTATAASLGGAQAAAHTAVLSVAMVCMVLGDVGSSLSQAFLPAFVKSPPPTIESDEGSALTEPETVFDMDAAMPTIKQLLKCTLSISATVVCLAAIAIGGCGGQISSDPAVLAEMRKTLPWIMTALSFHGSAVTLEGVLLSRKKFKGLSVIYTFLALTVAAFQIATKRFSLGLAGVWGCYVWFCGSRVIIFSAYGGLLRPKRWFQGLRDKIRSPPKPRTA